MDGASDGLARKATAEELKSLRAYRLGRLQAALKRHEVAAIVLHDPCNIRYATGARNMAVWTLHNHVRAAFVPAEGLPALFEFGNGIFYSDAPELETVGEILPIRGQIHFYSGSKKAEQVAAWCGDVMGLIKKHCGGERRIAFDRLDPQAAFAFRDLGIVLVDGEPIAEQARLIKSAEELVCIRRAVSVAEKGMMAMRDALNPGMTENQLWSLLHQVNIAHDGEWIETRLLSSGPRSNPWMQESSDKAIGAGELVAFDTDLIGPYGYCADISRTYFCGPGAPSSEQKRLYRASYEQIQHNCRLFTSGKSLRQVVEEEWPIPEEFLHFRYGLAHGVGLKDEYPFLPNLASIERLSDPDLVLEPGMTFSVESYVGVPGGRCGVKLEEQILVTETGWERLSTFPYEEILLD